MTHAWWTGTELVLLACALTASLALRPWRMLAPGTDGAPLATPFLATLTIVPWLWAWPAATALPIPLQWSAAPLAVLMLGWPLAVPLLLAAGLSTMLTVHASLAAALSTTLWSGLLPATLVLLLGHAARKAFGTHPAAYLLARAYAVPLLALFACALGAGAGGGPSLGAEPEMRTVVAGLLAMAEAAWTCAVATLLVACRPQWLATWSDGLYLGPPPGRKAA
ncbi:hypothetical protein ACFPOE_15335 [Caenimonas terrae]|uniref:Uncharacterized protein n=1 Tax=Caenimonas terrae TaxID=696074 RepID=A0ABW0NEZ5_9BURK